MNRTGKMRSRASNWSGAKSGAAVLAVAASLVGCHRESSDEASPAVSPVAAHQAAVGASAGQSPAEMLRTVFSRYRAANSYSDRGTVRLFYQTERGREEQNAPLSVWMNADMFYVEAYDVRLRSDGHRFLAWIIDPETNGFDFQVLSESPLAARPSLDQLLADPLLAQRVSGGLAGPPPQLEWLLAEEPMRGLYEPDTNLTRDTDATLDGRVCKRIAVEAEGEQYVFWIDPIVGLIRRVELPDVMAPVEAGQPVQRMRLQLDLAGATFSHPSELPAMSPLPQQPKFVDEFVPLPPPKPAAVIGGRPSAFAAQDVAGSVRFSHRGSDRPATVYAAIGADAASLSTAALLQHWSQKLPSPLAEQIRITLLADPSVADSLRRETDLAIIADQDRQIRDALGLTTGAVAVSDAEGVIAWHQPLLTAAGLPTWGAIIADILDGVDVPKRLRLQWQQQQRHYEDQLQQHRVHH